MGNGFDPNVGDKKFDRGQCDLYCRKNWLFYTFGPNSAIDHKCSNATEASVRTKDRLSANGCRPCRSGEAKCTEPHYFRQKFDLIAEACPSGEYDASEADGPCLASRVWCKKSEEKADRLLLEAGEPLYENAINENTLPKKRNAFKVIEERKDLKEKFHERQLEET